MSEKSKKLTFTSLLQEFLSIMELPQFQEIDRRLSKICSNDTETQQSTLSAEQFILVILDALSFVSDVSYMKIRRVLYKELPLIKEILDTYKLTKKELQVLLKHSDVQFILSNFKYESGEEVLTCQLLDVLKKMLESKTKS